jgi:hypothetical protein
MDVDEGEGAASPQERGKLRRFTERRRETFLAVLAQTGNRGMAAEAIGFEPRLLDQRRRYDALLDRQWTEALEQCERRLAAIDGPYDEETDGPALVIHRGPNGRLQLRKCGQKRWSRAVEDRFFATLAMCGNIGASARAVGFSQSCVDQRRRKWPDFEARLQETLDDAELEIEFRAATEARGIFERGGASIADEASPEGEAAKAFDMDSAMRFLKWREEKRRGRTRVGRNGRIAREPAIEDVTEKILRKVDAIKRHRARRGESPSAGSGK